MDEVPVSFLMTLVNASHNPPVTGPPEMTVSDACRRMIKEGVGSIGIIDEDNRFIGLFEDRDLTTKLVINLLDPDITLVGDVMTSPCRTISPDRTFADALNVMLEHNVRHLPIVDGEKHLLGVLSLRSMMQWKIEDLDNALRSVTSYFAADGIGGG